MYLIDTNVLSEYRKGSRANEGVVQFFEQAKNSAIYLPPQVIGEIRAGIAKLRRRGGDTAMHRAGIFELWLHSVISGFSDHILKFETDAAIVWGELLLHEKKDPHAIDKQIAAIALVYNLTVVTRDKGDAFAKIPNLRVLNPFN